MFILAFSLPTPENLLISAFAASLPISFFFWIRWWLSHEKEENPDEVVREQEQADEVHVQHAEHAFGHHAHGHGHAHSHSGH